MDFLWPPVVQQERIWHVLPRFSRAGDSIFQIASEMVLESLGMVKNRRCHGVDSTLMGV